MGLGTKIDCAGETTSNLPDRPEDLITESRLSNYLVRSVSQTAVLRLSGVILCHMSDTGAGQNNGNTRDNVHISLLIWYRTTFSLQYGRSPS
jgi:hypothetical protein